jgi:hypothetical protein
MIGFKEKTWRFTLFKENECRTVCVCDVELKIFEQARAKFSSNGELIDLRGRLTFLTSEGKEVHTGGVAYVAKEL